MYDPISVSTALVSSGGDLLIELTDGTIINAGRVRGNPGPQGEKGEQGIRGAHGKDGIDGTNGAKWHTGVGAPDIGLGEDGDLYMDVASSLLPIFQKVGGDWLFLSNLKPTSSGGVGATGEGAAGGGGSIIIFPSPIGGGGPDKPTVDNDGKPIQNGDLWYDPTTGHLWVYYNNQWTPISDRPPVIVGPNPPEFNSSSEDGTIIKYPLSEGDLWFDSDQAALYVAALNSDDDLVWVISTPADRSILQDEIPVGGFVFPAVTQDGDTVFNDTTGLWYVYNGSKKQWIDLPPGERELSYPGILREADPAIDETYEGEADAADGDVYLNAPDHEAGTRLVIRKVDRKGFAWTDFIQGLTEGDGIALVQTNYDNGPDNPQTQRVDYLIINSITENPDSFSIEVDYEQQNFDHLPLFGEEVSVRFLAQVSSPAVCVTFQEATPEPKCVGHVWFDNSEDQGALKIWNGEYWIPASPPTSLDGVNATITSALEVQAEILSRLDSGEANQVTIGNRIVELEEEIESLAPSLDRGKWNLATLGANITLASGEYAMGIGVDSVYCQEKYLECVANANNDPFELSECTRLVAECETAKDNGEEFFINDWSHATFLHFHKTDSDGKNHTFADYEVGMFIDLFDQGDTGFAVFEITDAPTLDGDVYTIGVTPIQHEGEASGLARIKVFELTGADPTDFVRKTGDEMSGGLVVSRRNDAGGNPDELLAVKGGNAGRNAWFTVKQDGIVSAGYDFGSAQIASESYHVITKKFMDLNVGPARFRWKVNTPSTSGPAKTYAALNGMNIASATQIMLNVQSYDSSYPFAKKSETWYRNQGSTSTNSSITITFWRYYAFEHQWIGTADVQKIVQNNDLITITFNHGFGSTSLVDGQIYFISVSGIF